MFEPKIRLDKELFEKAKTCAESAGYSSLEEFVTHLLEKEIAKLEEAESQKELEKRLQGLGYIE